MWNNEQMLSLIANIMFVMVFFMVLYSINLHYIKLSMFPLREVNVQGAVGRSSQENGILQNVTRQQIEQIVRLEITGNFFTVNLSAVQQALSKLPWVRNAKVYRDWPDGLNVVIEEHKVLAHWGTSALVNSYGEIFRATVDKELPLFVGPKEDSSREMAKRYINFSKILKPLRQGIAEISLSSRYAWCIRLKTGTVLKLGRGKVETALVRYSSVYQHTIAQLRNQFQPDYLDLRYNNGFAVRIPKSIQQFGAKQNNRRGEDVKIRRCN